jgi:hypothetical protein
MLFDPDQENNCTTKARSDQTLRLPSLKFGGAEAGVPHP